MRSSPVEVRRPRLVLAPIGGADISRDWRRIRVPHVRRRKRKIRHVALRDDDLGSYRLLIQPLLHAPSPSSLSRELSVSAHRAGRPSVLHLVLT